MRAFVVPVLLLMAACSAPEERPSELLPRDKFTQVLLEGQLIEARVNHEQVIDKITEVPALRYYAEMFEKEGVTEEQFKTTYQWYVDHPAELKDVYNDVLAGLQKRVEMTDSTGTAH
ncbi:MAG: DUF4296 domain-containing protein [Flavobacteriales bacterium]|nr:DUF4296 domain-containing protein [Flavobacteriales bacterium]